MSSRELIVRRYLKAMEAGDLEGVLACFNPDGIIVSPVYGEVPVGEFYTKLFADTVAAAVDIHTIYASPVDPNRWAAHFAYRWEKTDGSSLVTDLVDLFDFGGKAGLIARLRIIFDPKAKPAAATA